MGTFITSQRKRNTHALSFVLPARNLESTFRRIGSKHQRKKGSLVVYHCHEQKYSLITHSWLYTLFLALDGNFRMSRKGVSSKEQDPCLTEGRGYFVDDDKLATHLEAHQGKHQEVCPVIPNGLIIVLIF
jgi:hypothetical protein